MLRQSISDERLLLPFFFEIVSVVSIIFSTLVARLVWLKIDPPTDLNISTAAWNFLRYLDHVGDFS